MMRNYYAEYLDGKTDAVTASRNIDIQHDALRNFLEYTEIKSVQFVARELIRLKKQQKKMCDAIGIEPEDLYNDEVIAEAMKKKSEEIAIDDEKKPAESSEGKSSEKENKRDDKPDGDKKENKEEPKKKDTKEK